MVRFKIDHSEADIARGGAGALSAIQTRQQSTIAKCAESA